MDALIGAVARRLEVSAENFAGIALGYICIIVLLGAALVAFTLSAAILIAEAYGAAVAALCIGIFFLALAACLGIAVSIKRRRMRYRKAMLSSGLRPETALISQMLPAMLKGSPVGTLLVISLGAYLIARGMKRS